MVVFYQFFAATGGIGMVIMPVYLHFEDKLFNVIGLNPILARVVLAGTVCAVTFQVSTVSK